MCSVVKNVVVCTKETWFTGLNDIAAVQAQSCIKAEWTAWSVRARSPRFPHGLSYPTLLRLSKKCLFHYRFCTVNHRCALSVNVAILPVISCILGNYSEHLWCEKIVRVVSINLGWKYFNGTDNSFFFPFKLIRILFDVSLQTYKCAKLFTRNCLWWSYPLLSVISSEQSPDLWINHLRSLRSCVPISTHPIPALETLCHGKVTNGKKFSAQWLFMASISLKGHREHDHVMTLLFHLKVNSDYMLFFTAACVRQCSKQPEIN